MLGPGIGYTTLLTNPSVDPNQSAEFLAAWNTAKTAVPAIGGAGRRLINMQLIFGANNLLTVRYNYLNATGAAVQADADYTMVVNGTTGVALITLNATQPTAATYGNMNTLRPGVSSINTYLTTGTFRINWINQIIPGNIGFVGSLGAFYKTTNANSYFYGTMGQ